MIDRTACYDALDEPQKRGEATESILKTAFHLHDVPVLVPEYDDEPYHILAEIAGRFLRIQCKTAYRKSEGTVAFETISTRRRRDGYDRRGYEGQAEQFAVFDPINDRRYLIPIEDAADGKMELRFREPRNGQRVGINWAEEFLFQSRLDQLKASA